jgi:hypothetical protein
MYTIQKLADPHLITYCSFVTVPLRNSIKIPFLETQFGRCTTDRRYAFEEVVSDYVKSRSWCRRRRAHNWNGEPLGDGKWEWGGKEERGCQFTSNLGPESTGIAPHAKEGFQVSKRDSGTGEGPSGRRGIIKGIHQGVIMGIVPCAHIMTTLYISCYCVNVMLIKVLCLGYK